MASDTILIRDSAILTAAGWVQPGYVLVQGSSIATIGESEPPQTVVAQTGTVLSAQNSAVLPGLINGHTHLSQTFMRGLAGGRGLITWLKDVVWPMPAAIIPDEFYLAALIGLVENLCCGVTEVVNHHKLTRTRRHTDAMLDAVEVSGLRVTVARAWSDLGESAESEQVIIQDLEERFQTWHSHPRISFANGPLALWRCSAAMLIQTHALARQYRRTTHLHVSESADEAVMSKQRYDVRPVLWLYDLGILDTNVDVVHAVWVNKNELMVLSETGARVVHCLVSNAVLGSGIAPLNDMVALGVPVRLGTDGPASNDNQDLFETLKTAVVLARATVCDPQVLPPGTALRLATSGRVLATQAPADIVVVNLDHANAVPVHDITSALVLANYGARVESVIVDGRLLLKEGRLLTLDESALREACRVAAAHLRQRAF